MIPVNTALDHLFALVAPLETETVPLRAAAGRYMSRPVHAGRSQPPFDASSMDGYAVSAVEAEPDAQFKVIGEAAAGHGFAGQVGPGQAVRIFTGAPLPTGTDCVVIQEDVTRDGDLIALTGANLAVGFVRKAGSDFADGAAHFVQHALTARDIAMMAAMNVAEVEVRRRPEIAILPTGDELVQPGESPGPDQIVASNSYGLAAMLEQHGACARLLPIARDSVESLTQGFAAAEGADLLITIGGASVGDHDLVADVAAAQGMERAFYKIAMRPGKPLMAGRLGDMPMVGLPGNPVSAMVCGQIFILPMVRVMQGLPPAPAPRDTAPLVHDIAENGPREHYMRACLDPNGLHVFDRQDSALLGILAKANALVVRPPRDPARQAGEALQFILL